MGNTTFKPVADTPIISRPKENLLIELSPDRPPLTSAMNALRAVDSLSFAMAMMADRNFARNDIDDLDDQFATIEALCQLQTSLVNAAEGLIETFLRQQSEAKR